MSNNSVDVRLALIDERIRTIIANMESDRLAIKEQCDKVLLLDTKINDIGVRIQLMERNLDDLTPAMDEFIRMKHRAHGIGLVGKWVWVIVCAVVGALFAIRREIAEWVSK